MASKNLFLEPRCPAHRQYEALRAFFGEGRSGRDVAQEFGYAYNSFRTLCHNFKRSGERIERFFVDNISGAVAANEEEEGEHVELVLELRKQNFSVYDISKSLKTRDINLSPASVSVILTKHGFSKLPRRTRDNRLNAAETGSDVAPVADVRLFNPHQGTFVTKFGGLFLLLPYIVDSGLHILSAESGLPGTDQVPAEHAVRSVLALKLFGSARAGHVMSYAMDPGLALFAGLNCIPKRSFLGEYSNRVDPRLAKSFIQSWFARARNVGLQEGNSFDVDFHTIPFHGDDPLVGKHYISKRSRKQKGNLAFLVWDSVNTYFCFANGAIEHGAQANEIVEFAEYWKNREDGKKEYPGELIFDSTLTTYENLDKLNKMGIRFITLRRRSKKLVDALQKQPAANWRRITLDNVSRQFRSPRIIDDELPLTGYDGKIRQISICDLGHEEPTLLITNQLETSASKLVGRYARRMVIENGIADAIDFFHMDALSSSVALRVDYDLMITLIGGSLYRLFANDVGGAYRTAKFAHIFRDFIDAVADVSITDSSVNVRYQRRTHNPILMKAGVFDRNVIVPWWGGRKLSLSIK